MWRVKRAQVTRWCLAVYVGVLGLAAGCQPNIRIVHDDWANFPHDPKSGEPGANSRSNRSYAVLLDQFKGPGRNQKMFDLIRTVRERSDLADIWTQSRRGVSRLYVGRFKRRESFQAQTTLQSVRQTTINGKSPFDHSKLVAITARRGRQHTSPYDLRQFTGQGEQYTLEVAIFTHDTKHPREAAEKRARQLRGKGQKAFFYHGPHYSSVTIDLFTDADFRLVNKTESYGPRIKALQKKFAHLHVDGETKLRFKGKPEAGLEPTKLVRVPQF